MNTAKRTMITTHAGPLARVALALIVPTIAQKFLEAILILSKQTSTLVSIAVAFERDASGGLAMRTEEIIDLDAPGGRKVLVDWHRIATDPNVSGPDRTTINAPAEAAELLGVKMPVTNSN